MSDDGQYSDDDYEDMYYDEGPYAEADDLAEHTMPSPVWLDDNDPDIADFDDLLDDFMLDEYDDYFDQQPSTKRKRENHNGADSHTTSKRQKLSQTDEDSRNSVAASVVVWRTQAHSPVLCPVIKGGSGKGVAILKDWRERSKILLHDVSHRPDPRPRSSEKTFAVIIEQRQPQSVLQPEERNPEPVVNGTLTTASSRAKDKSNREPTSNSVPAAHTQRTNPSITAAPKRKRMELDDEEDELQADPSDFAQPRKRPMREPSRQKEPSTRGTVSKARGRKPKPSETDPPTSTIPTNGTDSKAKVSASSSTRGGRGAKVGSTARSSTRKKK